MVAFLAILLTCAPVPPGPDQIPDRLSVGEWARTNLVGRWHARSGDWIGYVEFFPTGDYTFSRDVTAPDPDGEPVVVRQLSWRGKWWVDARGHLALHQTGSECPMHFRVVA